MHLKILYAIWRPFWPGLIMLISHATSNIHPIRSTQMIDWRRDENHMVDEKYTPYILAPRPSFQAISFLWCLENKNRSLVGLGCHSYLFVDIRGILQLLKSVLLVEYHIHIWENKIHIWQVPLLLNCGITRQIWTWFKVSNSLAKSILPPPAVMQN